MSNPPPARTRCLAVALAAAWLAGCATPAADVEHEPAAAPPLAQQVAQALRALAEGQGAPAVEVGQRWLLSDPGSATGHLLLAAGHHLAGDPASADLAGSGYGAARQFGGSAFWPNYLAGVAAFQRQQMDTALGHFAEASLAEPDQPWGLEGVAAAAYASGRVGLALAAAQRALALDSGSALAWQTAVLAAAAGADPAAASALLDRAPAQVGIAQRRWAGERATLLLRTAAVDQRTAGVAAPGDAEWAQAQAQTGAQAQAQSETPAPAPAPAQTPPQGSAPARLDGPVGGDAARHQQLNVDVTLILADGRRTRAYGVNLLDGLQLQFGGSRIATVTRGSAAPTEQTVITRAIRLPDLTYNLNIFNRGNRFYEVMARPSLTAFTGQQSTFFVGEQLFVQVSGVNTAQLEKIDVGITLKITPSEVRPDGARFRIEADRSFFSDAGAGSFKEQLATFKQSVAATADIRFGETLVLSGLSETVRDGQNSRVPGLGDVPGPDILFSRSTQLERTRSVIILVTPSQPLGIARTAARNVALERLVALWDQVIEPRHGGAALIERLRATPGFSRAAAGDVGVRDLAEPAVRQAFAAALLRPLIAPGGRAAAPPRTDGAARPAPASSIHRQGEPS